ncbi:MAG: calcineurin-like phosphoesterase [Bacilli bacterium]|nr:calcineurin-like phosphoesterase [Bacilli bacterium]
MTRRKFLKRLIVMIITLLGAFSLKIWLPQRGMQQSGPVSGPLEAESIPFQPQVAPESDKPVTSDKLAKLDKSIPDGVLQFSMFLLSDIHISVYENTSTNKLNKALSDISKFDSKVDTIVFGGDLTDYGRDVEYNRLKSVLNGYKLPPLYGNMGNHDYYDIWIDRNGGFNTKKMPNGKKDVTSRDRFQKFIGYKDQPYQDIWINDVHLIMLSQEAYLEERPEVGEGAWYSDAQLEWLSHKMLEHQTGKPALIFIHQPLPILGSDGGSHQLIRATDFRNILKPYKNVFVFSGHTHRNFKENGHYSKESFHWISNASVGRTLPVHAEYDALKPNNDAQGCCIQIYTNKVVVRGREFSNQSWIKNANWTFPLE